MAVSHEADKTTLSERDIYTKYITPGGYNLDIKNPNTEAAKCGDPDELLADHKELLRSVAEARDALKAELAASPEGSR